MRQINAAYLPDKPIPYKNGDGLAAHVKEKMRFFFHNKHWLNF